MVHWEEQRGQETTRYGIECLSNHLEEEEEKERFLNEHEKEQAEEGHIEREERVELGKPRISKKLRQKLKKKGDSINVKEIASSIMKTDEDENDKVIAFLLIYL